MFTKNILESLFELNHKKLIEDISKNYEYLSETQQVNIEVLNKSYTKLLEAVELKNYPLIFDIILLLKENSFE